MSEVPSGISEEEMTMSLEATEPTIVQPPTPTAPTMPEERDGDGGDPDSGGADSDSSAETGPSSQAELAATSMKNISAPKEQSSSYGGSGGGEGFLSATGKAGQALSKEFDITGLSGQGQ